MTAAEQPAVKGDTSGVDLGAVFRVAGKRWRLVLFITTTVVVLAGTYVARHPKVYRATTTLKIDPHAIRPLGADVATPGDSTNFYWANKEYYETEYQIIPSRKVTERVVRLLRLNTDQGFLQSVPTGQQPPKKLNVTVTEAAAILSRRIIVDPEKKSRLIKISVEDVDPARAQLIINNVTSAYIEQNLDASLSNIGSAADWLNNQLMKLKSELESSEMALHEYKKDKRLLSASLDDQNNMLRSEMEQLHQALTDARTKREQLASQVEQLNRVNADDPTDLPSSELLESTTLGLLRGSYVSAKTEFNKLQSGGKGEEHPDVKRAQAEMVGTRAALVGEVRNIKEALHRDLAAIDREISGISGLYNRAEQQAFDLNLLEIEYKRLARTRENTERLHSIVLEKAKESELGSQMRFNNVSVVDSALLPKVPVKPQVGVIMTGGTIFGIVLGFLIALLSEKLRQRLDTPEDLEEQLRITCVGVIPEVGLDSSASLPPVGQKRRRRRQAAQPTSDAPELYVHRNPTSSVAEAVRALRTNLLFMSPDRPYKKLLVTSAGPTDGKTTIAASLAATLAHSGQRVLLVDGDLRKPRLSAVLGAGKSARGVTTATLDPSTLDATIIGTEIENMMLLPTGPLPPNPSELLQSERFHALLEQAAQKFDRVIIDSPPLVAVTDAAILSTRVDATLLVVRMGQTRREHALQALRALKDVNANVAGAVLNGVKKRPGSEYYYYGYYAQPGETEEAKA